MNRHAFQSFGQQCMVCGNGFAHPLHTASAGPQMPLESFSGPGRPSTAEERLREALSLVAGLTEQSRELRDERNSAEALLLKVHLFLEDLRTSTPGWLGKSCLQDYARFNEILCELPKYSKARSNKPAPSGSKAP